MRSLIKCFIRLASGSLDCIMAGPAEEERQSVRPPGPKPVSPYINS